MIERPKTCLLATCGGLTTILPVLKVSAYVFDFAKGADTGGRIGPPRAAQLDKLPSSYAPTGAKHAAVRPAQLNGISSMGTWAMGGAQWMRGAQAGARKRPPGSQPHKLRQEMESCSKTVT